MSSCLFGKDITKPHAVQNWLRIHVPTGPTTAVATCKIKAERAAGAFEESDLQKVTGTLRKKGPHVRQKLRSFFWKAAWSVTLPVNR